MVGIVVWFAYNISDNFSECWLPNHTMVCRRDSGFLLSLTLTHDKFVLSEVKVEPVTQDKGTSTVKQNGDEDHVIKTEAKPTTS